MRFFAGACRVPRNKLPERIGRLLALTDLEAKRDVAAGNLSGGMRQLLALGCARPRTAFAFSRRTDLGA